MLKLQFVKGSTLEQAIKRISRNSFFAPLLALCAFFIPVWCLPLLLLFWALWCAYTASQAYKEIKNFFSALKNSEPNGRTGDV